VACASSLGISAARGTRANPYPKGEAAKIDGFTIRVARVNTNAAARLQRASRRNHPPPPGVSFVLVTINATNRGKTASIPLVNGVPEAIGRTNRVYNPFGSCGTVPNDIANLEAVGPGKAVTANTCWAVPTSEVASLQMFYAPYGDGRRVFFALR
jgi:hypothetical protein